MATFNPRTGEDEWRVSVTLGDYKATVTLPADSLTAEEAFNLVLSRALVTTWDTEIAPIILDRLPTEDNKWDPFTVLGVVEQCEDCGHPVIYDSEDGWLHVENFNECNPCFLESQKDWSVK
tara:strand:+ start:1191 stop:1553 length:363 start_codon:yes stop_codon:yes gene_type:complete